MKQNDVVMVEEREVNAIPLGQSKESNLLVVRMAYLNLGILLLGNRIDREKLRRHLNDRFLQRSRLIHHLIVRNALARVILISLESVSLSLPRESMCAPCPC